MKKSRDLAFRTVVGVLAVVGALLLASPAVIHESHPVNDLTTAFGTAFLVAALLAVSVDLWLKKQLLQDSFKELFGYLLPPKLKEELAWVYQQQLLAERHELVLTLTPIDGTELFGLHVEMEREVRNIALVTAETDDVRTFEVDEWFHAERPSRVISLQCTQDRKTYGHKLISGHGFDLVAKASGKSLGSDEKMIVVAEAEETRRKSDVYILTLVGPASVNPRVTVNAPDEIDWKVMFGNRAGNQVEETLPGKRVELPGTLLPGQVIQVRWWPRDEDLRS